MSLLSSLREAPPPPVAVEIAATHVSGASLEWRGSSPHVAAHAREALAPGTVVPSLTASNIVDRTRLTAALARVLDQLGRPRRIALVLPDLVAKVSIIKFEQLPPRTQDLEQLVRWQVRKSAPFAIEEAQVAYFAGQRAADGQEFVVSMARRAIIQDYEHLASGLGAHAGLVDLSTFNIINAVLAADRGGASGDPSTSSGSSRASSREDWLLVNVAADYATIAILRGPHLLFFRNRTADTDGTLGDLVHQTAMYYEDRLKGGGFARVMLAGSGGDSGPGAMVEDVRRSLTERLATTVETVDPRGAASLTDRITAQASLLDTLTPLVGMLLRGRERAA